MGEGVAGALILLWSGAYVSLLAFGPLGLYRALVLRALVVALVILAIVSARQGRFAAKEACVKLFPREAALGRVELTDFSVARDAYGAPQLVCSPAAQYVLDLNRIAAVKLSLTHDRLSASAIALAVVRTMLEDDLPGNAARVGKYFLDRLEGLKTTPNDHINVTTMYDEGWPVLETPFSAAQAIHEMLLQSWGEAIHVFPGQCVG